MGGDDTKEPDSFRKGGLISTATRKGRLRWKDENRAVEAAREARDKVRKERGAKRLEGARRMKGELNEGIWTHFLSRVNLMEMVQEASYEGRKTVEFDLRWDDGGLIDSISDVNKKIHRYKNTREIGLVHPEEVIEKKLRGEGAIRVEILSTGWPDRKRSGPPLCPSCNGPLKGWTNKKKSTRICSNSHLLKDPHLSPRGYCQEGYVGVSRFKRAVKRTKWNRMERRKVVHKSQIRVTLPPDAG